MKFSFIPNRLFWVILFVFILAVAVAPAFAQDVPLETNTPALEAPVPVVTPEPTVAAPDPVVTPDPAPDVQQPITPDQAGDMLLSTILGIIAAGAGGSALTAFFVGLLKHIPRLDNISAPSLNFAVGGLLTIVYWIVAHYGYQAEFKAASDFILTSGPALITFLATMWGASKVHKVAFNEKLPVFGYKRPEKPLPETKPAFDIDKALEGALQGQGLVEYALILVLVAVVVIVILALLGPAIGNIFSNIINAL